MYKKCENILRKLDGKEGDAVSNRKSIINKKIEELNNLLNR